MAEDEQLIYKILTPQQWILFQKERSFSGSPVDLKDGYIHFSSGSQVDETAQKHFGDQEEIWLVAIKPKALGDRLKWEPSRGGQLFPHLYDVLSMDAVISYRLVKQHQGKFDFGF